MKQKDKNNLRNKENKQPLISQLNRTIGNIVTIQDLVDEDRNLHAVAVQLLAIRGGIDKIVITLLPDFIDTEIKAMLNSLIVSGLYDVTHCDCFQLILNTFLTESLSKRVQIYDIIHKN